MTEPITIGSLFAGIGGLDLGLERTGMKVKWQVEIDPFCQKVLAKHWPDVKRYEDITELTGHELEPVDLICGGFPCQDISCAGKRAGIEGERSGLFFELMRIVREVRPKYILLENVSALLNRGLDRVLGELATSGYDAEWDCIPASAVGAPHQRDRIFIISYRVRERCKGNQIRAYAKLPMLTEPCVTWSTEPPVLGVANGVPLRVDRLRALGNAVVPQVAEYVGTCIVEYDKLYNDGD